MKNVSNSCMIVVKKKNQKRNANINKNTIKRVRIDFAMRKIIQRRWNQNIDSLRHESIKQIAESLAIPYTTLHDELRRGCEGGVYCMYLRDKNKYQYFKYSAEYAEQDACEKGTHKGPRMKITNTFWFKSQMCG